MKYTPGPWRNSEKVDIVLFIALLDICKDLVALYVSTNGHNPMFIKKGLSIISKIEGRT